MSLENNGMQRNGSANGASGGAATVAVSRSLEEVHRSVRIPQGSWWRRMLAFAGPAYMVAVGYMDPGNWATDIAAGSTFGYKLIWVLLMSNLMAILLQTLSARLGLVTGRDLAQACRDSYGPGVRWILFILCEIAIAACDLAEVLGTAIGLNLLTGIPLIYAVLITGFDAMLLLAIQRWGIRRMEAFIIVLVATVGLCFIVEIFLSGPSWSGVASGFVPTPLSSSSLYIAIGILGATVMPHNLYLHSALVQSRNVTRTREGIAQATRFNFVDSAIALNCAFFVNAAILIVAAAAFGSRHLQVEGIQEAHQLLDNVLGTTVAPIAFALALIAAGQSSTVTGTLAGQITMEGFLHFRMRPWLRRLVTRSLAIIPAVIVISISGEKGTERLLILSQVILSLQLPFAVVPLVKFTSSRRRMRDFANPRIVKVLAWLVTAIIVGLNAKLVYDQIGEWTISAQTYRWVVLGTAVPAAAALGALLIWMILKPEREPRVLAVVEAEQVLDAALAQAQAYKRIGVALEARATDSAMLAEAIALAKVHAAELVLMHIVEGVGGQWYGEYSDDTESRHDDLYLDVLAERLRKSKEGPPGGVRAVLGYGDVPRELVRLVKQEGVDLMVVGGHGHHKLSDVFHGETIASVRHSLSIPVLAVRGKPPGPQPAPTLS